jgi:membrane protein YqaA with SNARE-associated domain
MPHPFKSATQVVLVLYSITLCIGILFLIICNPHDHDLAIGLLALFSNVVVGVISFYFGQKAPKSSEEQTTQQAKEELPTP